MYSKHAYIDGTLNITWHEILKNSDKLNYFDAKPLKPDKFLGIENNEIVSCYFLQYNPLNTFISIDSTHDSTLFNQYISMAGYKDFIKSQYMHNKSN